MQRAGLAHDTLARSLTRVPGLGVRSSCHRPPFQLSARVIVAPVAGLKLVPVAMQRSGPEQEMLSSLASAEWVSAAGSTRQLVPFHASASLCLPPLVKRAPPPTPPARPPQPMA